MMKTPRPPMKPLAMFVFLMFSNVFFVVAALMFLDPLSAAFWFCLAIAVLPAAFLTWVLYFRP